MKYLTIDNQILKFIDYHFNSNLLKAQYKYLSIEELFQWTHEINFADLNIMFEDLQRDYSYLHLYIPKKYLIGPIQFINYILKQSDYMDHIYLKPVQTKGYFRTYQYKFI